MIDWIINLFTNPGAAIRDLANRVAQGFRGLWGILVATFARWLVSATLMVHGAASVSTGIVALGRGIASSVGWIIIHYVPAKVIAATEALIRWARGQLLALAKTVDGWVQGAIRFARQLVADLSKVVYGWVATVRDELHKAVATLKDVARRVYTLLVDPAVMSEWIAGAIVTAVARWALKNSVYLGRVFLGTAVRGALAGASAIESVVAALFL